MAPSTTVPKFTTRTFVLGLVAAILVLALALVASVALWLNGVHDDMVAKEQRLSATYQSNQVFLDSYTKGFYETVSVADRKSAQLDTILTDAVRGRYDGQTSAQPGTGQLFSAITEAYPDLTQNLDVYDSVVTYITSNRTAFANRQDALLDQLRQYDTWRNSGLARKHVVGVLGAPSDNLRAQIGTNAVTGPAALEQMRVMVTSEATSEAFTTGNSEALTLPELP